MGITRLALLGLITTVASKGPQQVHGQPGCAQDSDCDDANPTDGCELAELHAGAPEGSEFAFVTPKRAAWIKAKRDAGTWKEDQAVVNNLTRDFKAIVRSAGIKDGMLHDLRRSCITHWAGKLPAAVVRDLTGHADIRTTLKYYVSIRDQDLAQAREITAAALLLDPKSTQIAVLEAK